MGRARHFVSFFICFSRLQSVTAVYIPLLCGCQVIYLGQTVLLSACGWYFIHSRLLAETLRVRAVRAR